jgi:hypothetical protein
MRWQSSAAENAKASQGFAPIIIPITTVHIFEILMETSSASVSMGPSDAIRSGATQTRGVHASHRHQFFRSIASRAA